MPRSMTCVAMLTALVTCTVAGAATSEIRALLRCNLDENLVHEAAIEVSSAAAAPGQKYSYEDMQDHNAKTRWASKRNDPPPISVMVNFDQARSLDTVVMIVTDLPKLYMTIRRVRIDFPDGSSEQAELEDRPGVHTVRFGERSVSGFTLVIEEAWQERNNFGFDELLAFHDPQQEVQRRVTSAERWRQIDVTPRGREQHPCVYVTPEEVRRARERAEEVEWARDYVDAIVRQADEVVGRAPEWIRQNCPPAGARFASGNSGCPICGAKWGSWRNADCSFDRPGTVRCSNGHVLPDADHPDDGGGYIGEDGRPHYFVASYNSWVVETYQQWSHHLAFAYAMTGDERYAQTCAILFDALAEIYPTCTEGSVEYPSGHGRMNRPGYQTARVLVTLVEDYDFIYASTALDQPSFVTGLTRRENIERNMLQNGAWYCYQQTLDHPALHNGQADYIRGALSVGCLLGIEAYVDWAVDGPFGIYALTGNNVGRDGRYMETSLSYSHHSRDLYLTFAEPLLNYHSERYPEGLNLYDDPHFRSFYALPMRTVDCAGHWPRYGDAAPDVNRMWPVEPVAAQQDMRFAERFYSRSTDPEVRASFGAILSALTDGDVERARGSSVIRDWLLFHAREAPDSQRSLPEDLMRRTAETMLLGQKGMAFLRTPRGPNQQVALLRYGPAANHSHFDDLNLNYYAQGWEVTYDIGYGWGNTHTQVGWAKQTAAHNLVLVNEARQRSTAEDGTGGSLHLLAGMPGLQVVDADAPAAYRSQGVTEYRRMLALVGDGPGSYLLDVFTVAGGTRHDYSFHALSDEVAFEGVALSEPAEGSVAGPEYDWGVRQLNDGFLSGVPHQDYWVAPPHNGLGFMMHPRRGTPDGPWSATWTLPSGDDYLRLTMLPQVGVEVVSAWAPGIYPNRPKAEYILARRSGEEPLESTFVGLIEPHGPAPGEGGLSAQDLLERAATDEGELRYLTRHDALLFKGEDWGSTTQIALPVPEDGQWWLEVAPYESPGYGACQILLNGESVGEPIVGFADTVGPGERVTLGPMELTAGEHALTLQIVEHDQGNPWIGISGIALRDAPPAAASRSASPRIRRVRRLDAADGVTALAVECVDGGVDRFIYDPTGKGGDAGKIAVEGHFGAIRGDTGDVVAAHIVGGRVSTSGFELALPRATWEGRITEIDRERRLVYVDADLPDDGRLSFEPVIFSNDVWSRNSAYTMHQIVREGGRTAIDLGPQRLELGRGTVEEVVGDDTLLSLTPHDYALGKNDRLFAGKTVVNVDGQARTRIIDTSYGTPFKVRVESTGGFETGDTFEYLDLAPGDRFVIHNWATVTSNPDGWSVSATDDVTLVADGREIQRPWVGQ